MGFASEAKVGNFDSVSRRRRRGSDKVGVSAKGRGIVRGRSRDKDVFGFDIAVEKIVGVNMVKT
jgi:hypothetical protein